MLLLLLLILLTKNVWSQVAVDLVDLWALARLFQHWFVFECIERIEFVYWVLGLSLNIIWLFCTQVELWRFEHATESGCWHVQILGLAIVVCTLIFHTVSWVSIILVRNHSSILAVDNFCRTLFIMALVIIIKIPKLIKILLFVRGLKIEWSWSTSINIWIIHLTVVVSPLLLAILERRNKA